MFVRAAERSGALTALVLASFPISLLTLLLFLETGKPPLERRSYHLDGRSHVRLLRFRTGGRRNLIGGLLERTGLAEAPKLIDIAAGRLPLSGARGRRARLALKRSGFMVRR
jgi:hypothetical protein